MDPFDKPTDPDENILSNLGPLTPLAGVWEGDKGVDVSPSRNGPVESLFRERIIFEPMGPVVNGPQVLYGLRYSTTAWPLGDEKPFHEELGYWMWDKKAHEVIRCFMVPRIVTINACGHADSSASSFMLSADAGSGTHGILSSPFLDKAFKTVRYLLNVTIHDSDSFSYEEDTQLQIHGQNELFHHTDRNRLKRCSS
jgi:hypothetical protein